MTTVAKLHKLELREDSKPRNVQMQIGGGQGYETRTLSELRVDAQTHDAPTQIGGGQVYVNRTFEASLEAFKAIYLVPPPEVRPEDLFRFVVEHGEAEQNPTPSEFTRDTAARGSANRQPREIFITG